MTIETMIVFSIVPTPGFCLKGIHKQSTPKLTKKVVKPMLYPVLKDIPCARTVQGLTPTPAVINNVSPNPNNIKPRIRYIRVILFGFRFRVSTELHESTGIFLKVKINTSNFINFYINN